MKLYYLILAHKNPEQLARLVGRLVHSEAEFYIHLDAHVDVRPFVKKLEKYPAVHFVPEEKRAHVTWGDFSMVEAMLALLDMLDGQLHDLGYCVLMSGQDYPIKSNREIEAYFEQHYGMNFINGTKLPVEFWPNHGMDRIGAYNFHPLKRERFNLSVYPLWDKRFYRLGHIYGICNFLWRHPRQIGVLRKMFYPKRRCPGRLIPHGGSQWWALPVETVKLIADFLRQNPAYIQYHKYTHVPDELFFQTIVYSLCAGDKIADSLTYVNWARKGCPLPVTFTHADAGELDNDQLFARKFDLDADARIFDILDHGDSGNRGTFRAR
jgi:hypothetical protein